MIARQGSEGLQARFLPGTVTMETVLAYTMDQAYTSTRRMLLAEYRNSVKVRSLIERGVLELDAVRHGAALRAGATF